MTLSPALRQRIRERAHFLCEYCHSSEEASAALFTFDHLMPQSLGGSDDEDNLALACHRCNGRRYNFTDGFDPVTQTIVPLFHPRREQWAEHFIWSADGQSIRTIDTRPYPVEPRQQNCHPNAPFCASAERGIWLLMNSALSSR